jgi:hypothetical protein
MSASRSNEWKRFGVYIFDLDTIDAGLSSSGATSRAQFLSWMAANHVGWVACQCFDGDAPGVYKFQSVMGSWRDDIRALGMDFGVWGVHHNDPTSDAARAINQIDTWGPDFYIADAEAEYKTDTGGTRAHSATFVNAFRATKPSFKAALTSYGGAYSPNVIGDCTNAAASVFDYKAWYDAGFHFHPQAYYNQNDVYDPLICVLHAQRANWPLSRVHIIVGIFSGGIRTMHGADYVPLMRQTDALLPNFGQAVSPQTTYGFSAFLGDQMIQQDFVDLGANVFDIPGVASRLAQDRAKRVIHQDVVFGL